MTKIGLMMPVWKRPEVTRLVAEYHVDLKVNGVILVPLAVVSRAEDRRIVSEAGWDTVEADNEPLSEKHNAGMQALSECEVDGVFHLNSDDFLSKAYIEWAVGQEDPVLTLHSQAYYDGERLVFLHGSKPGSGTYLSKEVLDEIGWTPWRAKRNRHLDKLLLTSAKNIAPIRNVKTTPRDRRQMLGIKGSQEQMWSFSDLVPRVEQTEIVPKGEYLPCHFPKLEGRLETIS